MDKMREEFEAWHIEQCKADGMDWRDLSSELDRDGDGYVYTGAQYAWRGWKASRSALCVELNNVVFSRDKNGEGGLMLPERVFKAMDDAGVYYK